MSLALVVLKSLAVSREVVASPLPFQEVTLPSFYCTPSPFYYISLGLPQPIKYMVLSARLRGVLLGSQLCRKVTLT